MHMPEDIPRVKAPFFPSPWKQEEKIIKRDFLKGDMSYSVYKPYISLLFMQLNMSSDTDIVVGPTSQFSSLIFAVYQDHS